MNKRINKNVLDGFLHQAISHNRFIEEQEMWKKKREEAKEANKRKLNKHKTDREEYSSDESIQYKQEKKKDNSEEIDDLKVLLALYQDHKKPVERWGHSGYEELYGPDGTEKDKPSSSLLGISSKSAYESKKESESDDDDETRSRKKHKKHKHRSKKKKSKKSKKRSRSSSSSSSDSSSRKKSYKHKKKY